MDDLIKRSDALKEIASYMAYTFKNCGASSPRYSAMYEEAKVFQRTSEAYQPKPDTIVAIGYAERQREKTLAMAGKVRTEL